MRSLRVHATGKVRHDGGPALVIGTGESTLPLVIVPHAAGWAAEATAGYWRDTPIRRGAMAVFPFGHGRRLELRSMGWRGQIADLASLPRALPEIGYYRPHTGSAILGS